MLMDTAASFSDFIHSIGRHSPTHDATVHSVSMKFPDYA